MLRLNKVMKNIIYFMNTDFLRLFLEGNKIEVPENILIKFKQLFSDAKNVEWYENNNVFEAIFYNNNQEIIVKFDNNGNLLETAINMPFEEIPKNIKEIVEKYGEIMNFIKFIKNNTWEYEFIVKDNNSNRYLLIFDSQGNIIKYHEYN